ncbi:MAG: hypothetical protein ACI353_03525 [Alloprevotella sp.]
MSDGNFNRNLLPYRNYQSGFRAGAARTRALAIEAFARHLDQHLASLTPEQRDSLLQNFKRQISPKG